MFGSRPFLTAEWRHLAIISYAVDPSLLAPHLPSGIELDTHPAFPGRAFVSLVAFDFLNTRVKGIRWPGLVNFPEINLRFYVRECPTQARPSAACRKGVCFIKEIVPSRLISLVARGVYNEPYEAASTRSERARLPGLRQRVLHTLTLRGTHTIEVSADERAITPPADSLEHWFKEHQWGYGIARSGATLVYEVRHPVWAVYPNAQVQLNFDFAAVYGSKWRELTEAQPASVVLAEGSPVSVWPAGRLG